MSQNLAPQGKTEILLETGTNEMEIIEFYLADQPFGINVQKLKEIIPFDPAAVTAVPDRGATMLGTLLLRGSTFPLVDLKMHIGKKSASSGENVRPVVLVCDFNGRINGFKVDGVNMIHRVSWENVKPLAAFIDQYHPRFTGSINIDGREILIVDLEHIISEFDPESALDYDVDMQTDANRDACPATRKGMKLMLAEDSSLIRNGIKKVLTLSNYTDLQAFVDGEDCYRAIMQLKKKVVAEGGSILDHLNLLITDIEMPRLDGLTLCRRIKEDPVLKDVKVVLFSSLINEQMAYKCDDVGADGYATKPQIPYLMNMMDEFLGIVGVQKESL